MVHRVTVPHDQFRDRHERKAFFFQGTNDLIQRFCRVFRPIVAQDDGTVAQILVIQDIGKDGIGTVIFPVQTIITRHKSKDYLYCKNKL